MKKIFKIILPIILLAIILLPFSTFAKSLYYKNIFGSKIHVPVQAQIIPKGASAQCRNGKYSFSVTRRGTCSGNGGVKIWYK
ncbi:MAG: DUF3761 domain-containing protein [Candidatus Paceibacterota bacterium]|jgi:hypothetical protein